MKVKQKLLCDRVQPDCKRNAQKSTESNSLLTRLQKQYQINKENESQFMNQDPYHEKRHQQKKKIRKNIPKQMDMKVPSYGNCYQENYFSGVKSSTKYGLNAKAQYRYNNQSSSSDESQYPYFQTVSQLPNYAINAQMTQSLEGLSHRQMQIKSVSSKNKNTKYKNLDIKPQVTRPLTFGIVKNCSMISSKNYDQQEPQFCEAPVPSKKNQKYNLLKSQEYLEEKRIKEEVLDQIISRKSQKLQTKNQQQKQLPTNHFLKKSFNAPMINSIQDTVVSNLTQSMSDSKHAMNRSINPIINPCINHPNKRSKYQLANDVQEDGYCSKCAINLLQQGFKVEQIKKKRTITLHSNSKNFRNSIVESKRLKQLKDFQEKIDEVEQKLVKQISTINENSSLADIEEQIQKTNRIYEAVFAHMTRLKEHQVKQLKTLKDQVQYKNRERSQDFRMRVTSLHELKKQLKEYTNKFIEMKEDQYHFLLQSFINKVEGYENLQTTVQKKKQYRLESQSQNYFKSKVEKIITELYYALTDKKSTELSFDRKQESSQDFYCEEVKQPFRNLFPEQQQSNQFESSINEGDSPTFKSHHY